MQHNLVTYAELEDTRIGRMITHYELVKDRVHGMIRHGKYLSLCRETFGEEVRVDALLQCRGT